MGQFFFAAIAIFLTWGELITSFSTEDVLLLILPIMLLSIALIRNWFRQKASKEAKNLEASLDDKVVHYQRTMLVCSCLLESMNIFAIVCFLLNPNIYFLLFFAVGVLLFLQIRPSANDFVQEYKITNNEQRILMGN